MARLTASLAALIFASSISTWKALSASLCAASTGSSEALKRCQIISTTAASAQNGNIIAKGVKVAEGFYNGLFGSDSRRVYLPWALGSFMSTAKITYDTTTDTWCLDLSSFGSEFV
ncbi:hypothetical protein D6C99_08762 [Aureobasidium pullulans]|nr:hypothetical protein D6C99_08762 [Aureobasidium pullulans]